MTDTEEQDEAIFAETIKVGVMFIFGIALAVFFAIALWGNPYYLAEISPLGIVVAGIAWLTKRVGIW